MSESAVSAKRALGLWFGAKPAQSEPPVRAAAKRRPPERGRSGKRWRSLPLELTDCCYGWEVSTQQALTAILNVVHVAFSTDRRSADFGQPGASLCRDEKECLQSRVGFEPR